MSVTQPRSLSGFSLIELIMVMLIISALAVFAMPKVLDVSLFRLASYADSIQNATAFANRLSLAQRRPIVVTFATTGMAIAYSSGGAINLPVVPPGARTNYTGIRRSGISALLSSNERLG